MKIFFFLLGALLVGTAGLFAQTNVYYVDVNGNDGNVGSKEKPFATLNKANAVVNAGDTVWIRGGVYNLRDTIYVKTYNISAGIHLTASGESDDKRIHYLAYPGERPIFDGTNLLVGEGYDHYDGTIKVYSTPRQSWSKQNTCT